MKTLSDNKPNMHSFINIVDEWKKVYYTKNDVIIFQNKEQLSNIRFDNNSFHAISKNLRGVENLPETINDPSEIWSKWADANQRSVLRNYILFGSNGNFVVTTKDGIIQNAIFVVNSRVDRYRTGLLLIR